MSGKIALYNVVVIQSRSFAIVVWECTSFGKTPYEGMTAMESYYAVLKGTRLPQKDLCSDELYALLLRCWSLDAAARPSFSEILGELYNMQIVHTTANNSELTVEDASGYVLGSPYALIPPPPQESPPKRPWKKSRLSRGHKYVSLINLEDEQLDNEESTSDYVGLWDDPQLASLS